ncbi:MAG TPA: hypothetical protein VFE63_15925 [Roseiarcus sp.]|jgi:hypothetical protein|nr:hypothetical protein [Roseiarcus sp.]
MTTATHQFRVGDIVQPMGRDHRYKVIAASRTWVWVDDAAADDQSRDGPIAFQARDVELVRPAPSA